MRRVTRVLELPRSQLNPKRRNWTRRSERILVAVNFTEDDGALVTWALTHGWGSGDAVTVIHVVGPCPSLATLEEESEWERQKSDMLNILSDLVTHCQKHYDVPEISIIVEVVENASIGDAIVHEARRLEATRVILGKHKSRPLDISPKRMTDLGGLCVKNLEPYCEVVIVRNGKVIIRRPGTAKFRRSLETLLLSNMAQESKEESDEFEAQADNNGRQLVVGGFAQLDDGSPIRPNESTKRRLSSSSVKSSILLSVPLSHFLRVKPNKTSSQDPSFSPGNSTYLTESSPKSVFMRANHDGKSSFDGGGLLRPASFTSGSTSSSTPLSFQMEWLKGGTDSARSSVSRSSSHSLESVLELPSEGEDRSDHNKDALIAHSQPQLDIRDEDPEEFGPLGCHTPQLTDRKDQPGGEEEATLSLAGVSPQDLENMNVKDREEEAAARESLPEFSPPHFARTCSDLTYNLSQEGLQSLSTDVNVELPQVGRFSYKELRAAADNFAPRNVVGTGGASSVYKARLRDGRSVALKRLVDNMAGEKEFMMEMMMLICTLNHPNLVTMIGFCAEGAHRLIAYKLLARGSLEQNLHNATDSAKPLNWEQRQKVAFGASRGLAYLHSFSPKPIIHRDIKTSNILLADDFEAQISDFGLARWLSEADNDATDDQVSCAGTFGYLAPESLMYGGFNERTDVFAFGVVLLELISGRRPMDESLPEPEQSLVRWARTLQQNGQTHRLVDRSLEDINPRQFKRMMYAAFLCVQVSPADRPTMDRVVRLLDPDCNYSPAILQPSISAPPFMSMPELKGVRGKSPLALPSIPPR